MGGQVGKEVERVNLTNKKGPSELQFQKGAKQILQFYYNEKILKVQG